MCAVGALDAAPLGTLFGITGAPADALLFDTGMIPGMDKTLTLAEGTIDIEYEADNAQTNDAKVKFEIWYKPLDAGATITAVA